MTPNTKEQEWDFAKFKRYVELFRRNYIEDNLWGKDPVNCSAEFKEFTELEPLFISVDNTQIMIDKITELESALKVSEARLKKAVEQRNACCDYEWRLMEYNQGAKVGEFSKQEIEASIKMFDNELAAITKEGLE